MDAKLRQHDRVGVEICDLIKVYRTKVKDVIALRGIDASIPAERLEFGGLRSRADHARDAWSGGEQQRVALGVALANDPPLLLADEPTGELDSVNAEAVMGLLRDVVHEHGKTAMIVSHDPRIGGYVDQVLRM